MAMMTNDPSGGFQGIPGPPQAGVGAAALPPGTMGAAPPPPYIPRSLTLKEYVQMARAKKMVPSFTNVSGQGGQFQESWMGPDGQGRGNAFVQPGEFKMGAGGEPQRNAIPSQGQRPGNQGPKKQLGQMTPEELRGVDIYQMALDKTKSQIPALFKHVFGDRARTPRDLSAAQVKHWQKQVQALNNHNLKGLDKQMERNIKLTTSKNLLQDEEGKAAVDERKGAESDYKAWEAMKAKDSLNTESFEDYRKRKGAAIDKVAPKPRKKQPPPVMSGEQTGIPEQGPEPIPGWGPGSADASPAAAGPSQAAVMAAAERAYKASGGDKQKFAMAFQKEIAGAPPGNSGAAGGGGGWGEQAPQGAIPEEAPEEEQYQE